MASNTDDGETDPRALPTSDIEVEAHVHFAMAGSFPLRMAEFFFTDSGVFVAEYSYIMPLFGLGLKTHHKNADAMAAIYDRYGIDGVLMHGDKLLWFNYGMIDRVALYSGGVIGRPKVTIYAEDGESYAYRLLGEYDFDELTADLNACASSHGMTVESRDGIGLNPRENLARFFRQS